MLSHFSLKGNTDSEDAKVRAFASPNARRSLFEYSNVGEGRKTLDGDKFSNSPLSNASQKLLKSPKKPQRKIPKMPFKGFWGRKKIKKIVKKIYIFCEFFF